MTQQTPISMELAEFFAKIVLDAFDGVRESMRLQEERQMEIAVAASLDGTEFAQMTVTDEELERELVRIFPSPDHRQPHCIYVGAPYRPALKEGETESPPLRALTGIQLERADYMRRRGSESFVLTKTAVEKVLGAVRTRLGAQSQSVLRAALARGVPRLVVDSGRIGAKISLTLQSAAQSSAKAAFVVPRRDARLLVRMIDDRAPQNQQLRVDILSELEVTFKTVT